ncbi:MAG: type II secretion protein [Dissulfurimicrobium sp.]|nr:type II secretion protein [Dissulfurimicrobium hydrothermale]UKL13559.1 type II secretion protein [Dissulfurimicrobium hydrothermale]
MLTAEELHAAEFAAQARGIDMEVILIREYGLPRHVLLKALSNYYNCPFIEYDERTPIPPELLSGLNEERPSITKWFPVIKDGDTVIIATNNPKDPEVLDEVTRFIKAKKYEFWVALKEDIGWFIQDFLHAPPGQLIGTERTGLAYWRNTMAHWRTRLACYRTDMAKARTDLAFLRWGLGLVAISNALMRTHKSRSIYYFYFSLMAVGLLLGAFGLTGYLKIRKTRMKPPEHQTLVEVTAATLHFLENYHFIEGISTKPSIKKSMLARLGDFLAGHSTIIYPSPASRERTHLARERNVLASQRTIAGCYRTIYARARTGLAFIRTGVSFTSLGLGLIKYFGFSLLSIYDAMLVVAGILMVTDGLLWYLPVRKEQSEIPRCVVPDY